MDPIEGFCFPMFGRAAEAVAAFELRVRMLADTDSERVKLQRAALSGDLTALIDQLCDEYKAADEERAFLAAVAGLRNNLFHLKLSRVTGRVTPLAEQLVDEPLRKGGVWMANLDTGKVGRVSTTSTEDGRIYGWLLESTTSRAFEAVERAAKRGAAILKSLRDRDQACAIAAMREAESTATASTDGAAGGGDVDGTREP